MKCFVIRGAGFIGSNLVDELHVRGYRVCSHDNFSTGQVNFLSCAQKKAGFTFIEGKSDRRIAQ